MKIRPVLASIGLVAALTATGALADEPVLVERTERVHFNIGCDRSGDAPTCDSTEYWLGTDVGSDDVASTFDATPMGYAFYQLDGEYSTTIFSSNSTLADSYVLKGGSEITGQITLSGFLSGAEVGVDSGVYVGLSGTRTGTTKFAPIGDAEVTKVVSTPVDTTYRFTIEVPAALDGVGISNLTAELGQRHVTVLQNGFVNGTGDSWFDLPYLVPAE